MVSLYALCVYVYVVSSRQAFVCFSGLYRNGTMYTCMRSIMHVHAECKCQLQADERDVVFFCLI